MNKPLVTILLGAGVLAVGYVLFWPKTASAATKPGTLPAPTPQAPRPAAPAPAPVAVPKPAPAAPAPAPVPIPPKIDAGPGSQVAYPLLVTGDGVNVRTGPSTSYPVITTLAKGTRLQLPHSNSWSEPTNGAPQGWSGVLLPSGQSGWIASQYLVLQA